LKKHFINILFLSVRFILKYRDDVQTRCRKTSTRQQLNDGSYCEYRRAKVKPKYSIQLPGVLHETSGLVFSDNLLWTTNDDTDTTVYGVDTSGIIQGNGP
jgi:hypothetical protein